MVRRTNKKSQNIHRTALRCPLMLLSATTTSSREEPRPRQPNVVGYRHARPRIGEFRRLKMLELECCKLTDWQPACEARGIATAVKRNRREAPREGQHQVRPVLQ